LSSICSAISEHSTRPAWKHVDSCPLTKLDGGLRRLTKRCRQSCCWLADVIWHIEAYETLHYISVFEQRATQSSRIRRNTKLCWLMTGCMNITYI